MSKGLYKLQKGALGGVPVVEPQTKFDPQRLCWRPKPEVLRAPPAPALLEYGFFVLHGYYKVVAAVIRTLRKDV